LPCWQSQMQCQACNQLLLNWHSPLVYKLPVKQFPSLSIYFLLYLSVFNQNRTWMPSSSISRTVWISPAPTPSR
jgi:hypothetical protein